MSKLIGITGGIATGKTTVSNYLVSKGYLVISADDIVHELYNNFGVIQALACMFQTTSRSEIGAIVFKDPYKRKQLEDLLHPLIKKEINDIIKESKEEVIFIDVPLLFEAKFDTLVEQVICVYINKELQLKRLMARDSINKEYALLKIESQLDIEEKKKLSDYVIDNSNDLENTYKQVDKILERIR